MSLSLCTEFIDLLRRRCRSSCKNMLLTLGFSFLFFAQTFGNGPDIPLDLMKELSQMASTEAVLRRYGGGGHFPVGYNFQEPQALAIQINIGSDKSSPSNRRIQPLPSQSSALVDNVPLAENAGCAPTETVIEMPKVNSSVVIYPLGTKVMRCAGICGHSNLQCRPTSTKQFIRKGLILVYRNGALQPTGHQNFTLEDHLSCSCDCFQKVSDCKPFQRYDANNCKCSCRNQAEMAGCGPHRVWDYKECRCKCPNICTTCPFGMYFDESYSCACVSPQQTAVQPMTADRRTRPGHRRN